MDLHLRQGRGDALSLTGVVASDGVAEDRAAFIRSQTRLAPVAFVPEIQLLQADDATALWHLTEAELGARDLPPPFWAFAWAGGQGLARHVLDNPDIVRGRRVIDFASGSGLVAIAAAKAGAALVTAVDIDPFARAAILENAAANDVVLASVCADIIGSRPDTDILLAGDIFYDRGFAAAVIPWLSELALGGVTILVGDPDRAYRPIEGFREMAVFDVPVHPALEDAALKRVRILGITAGLGPS